MWGGGQCALVRVVPAGILWPTCAQTSPVQRWLAGGVSRLLGELRGRALWHRSGGPHLLRGLPLSGRASFPLWVTVTGAISVLNV